MCTSWFAPPFPVLPSFPCFFWKKARKTAKKTRIFYPYRTPKIPGKEEKNAQKKTRKSLQGKKQGNPQKNKERKDRVEKPPPPPTVAAMAHDALSSGCVYLLKPPLGRSSIPLPFSGAEGPAEPETRKSSKQRDSRSPIGQSQ